MNAHSERLAGLIAKAGINAKAVQVLGAIAHIDSFEKYHDAIVHLMTSAGFVPVRASTGYHMDGSKGYRASFKLAS